MRLFAAPDGKIETPTHSPRVGMSTMEAAIAIDAMLPTRFVRSCSNFGSGNQSKQPASAYIHDRGAHLQQI